uniref:Uncharacterized protein n=1 Tax=Chenopodium quinoa TaxID=63459 RepID=A0A803M1R9_CHEQI
MQWRLDNELVVVPFSGPLFTWTNNRLDSDPIFERLDRAYASPSWMLNYPDTSVVHQPILFSDHAAIVLSDVVSTIRSSRPYRIENWCLSAAEVHSIISSTLLQFQAGSPMYSLSRKLQVLKGRLLAWCVSHRKLWGVDWKTLATELGDSESDLQHRSQRRLFLNLRNEKLAAAQVAFSYWCQRAKVRWNALGERHSKLLFSSVHARRRRNAIHSLKDTSGQWITDAHGIHNVISSFYSDLYTPSSSTPIPESGRSTTGSGGKTRRGRGNACGEIPDRNGSSEEDIDVNNNFIDPSAEDRELKGQLLRKYSGYLGSLRQEFLKKRKKGKLPKEARQQLLDWWSRHYKWPYPSESQKLALAESTGLDQKQINNWFINQRKRHWKPSEDMQFVVMDAAAHSHAHSHYGYMDNVLGNPFPMDVSPTLM